jgi:hypothetical protein
MHATARGILVTLLFLLAGCGESEAERRAREAAESAQLWKTVAFVAIGIIIFALLKIATNSADNPKSDPPKLPPTEPRNIPPSPIIKLKPTTQTPLQLPPPTLPIEQEPKSSFTEDVISRTKHIESLLAALGGFGKGLHERASSIESILDYQILGKLRYIASIRNKLVHEHNYNFDGNEQQFVSTCDATISQLKKLVPEKPRRGGILGTKAEQAEQED